MNKTYPLLSRMRVSVSRMFLLIRAWLLTAIIASGLLGTAMAADGYNPRPDSGVLCLAYQADGKLIVGGHFTLMSGTGFNAIYPRLHLARLNTDGTVDTSFYPSADGDVTAVLIQPDGKIIIGGTFQNVTPSGSTTSVARSRLARLNKDGSVDATFAPSLSLSTGTNINVFSIVRQPDGKILVGGVFDTVNGKTDNNANLVRLNSADGSIDTSFKVKTNDVVKSIGLQTNGNVIIGGGFTSITALSSSSTSVVVTKSSARVARLSSSGVFEERFVSAPDNVVNAVLVQADDKIVIGGQFISVTDYLSASPYNRYALARLNKDGDIDTTFYPGANAAVTTLALQSDGKIVIGGHFSQIFSQVKTGLIGSNYVARINADGTADSSFQADASQYVTSIAVQDDGKLVVGGWFSNINAGAPTLLPPIPYLARLYSSGAVDTDWTPGSSSTSLTFSTIQSDGKMIITGNIASIGGLSYTGIARIGTDGTLDTSFNCSIDGTISHIEIIASGRILLTGTFTKINGVARTNVAILNSDGSLYTTFAPPTINSSVYSAGVQSDGKVIIGGGFNLVGTTTRNYIARLNADGTLDTAFDPNASAGINVIKVMSDGRILVGGSFTTFAPNGGTTALGRSNIAMIKTDGTLDGDFIPAINSNVFAIEIQSDGKILVGGTFTVVYTKASTIGQTRNRLLRLNADGYLDNTFAPDSNGYIAAIKTQADGKIVIAGNFSTINSVSRNLLARLNADGTLDTGYNPSINGGIASLLLQSDGSMVVVGRFSTVQPPGAALPIARPGLAKITATGTLDANWGVVPAASTIGEVDVVTNTRDGSLYVGGRFSNLAGSPGPNLARFGANGGVDSIFNPAPNNRVLSLVEMPMRQKLAVFANRFAWVNSDGTARLNASSLNFTAEGGRIYTTVPMADGSALIGGQFTITGPTRTISNLARIKADGSLDESFVPQPDSVVTTLTLAGGKLMVGGGFANIGGLAQGYIARLNLNGTIDSSFTPRLDAAVYTIAMQADNQYVIGGLFTKVYTDALNSTTRNKIARLTSSGTLDTTFDPNSDGQVDCIAIQRDGKILMGGLFSTLQPNAATTTTTRLRMARLNTDGTVDTTFEPSILGELISMVIQPDNKILIAGGVQSANPFEGETIVRFTYLARINLDGTVDAGFKTPEINSYVNQIALNTDGSIIAVGTFTKVGDVNQPYVARFTSSGALDPSFVVDANTAVYAVAIASDKSVLLGGSLSQLDNEPVVLAGGEFTAIGGQPHSYLALLSHNGQSLDSFVPTPDGVVNSLARQLDGNILIAGAFKNVSGKSRQYIARLLPDASVDDTFKPDADGPITAMVLQSNGGILTAGSFTRIANTSRQGLARLKTDGSIDPSFTGSVTGAVSAMAVDDYGQILVGGSFTGISGTSTRYLAKLSPIGALDTTFNVTTDGPVNAISTVVGGQVIIGGSFTKVNGQARSNYARLNRDGTLVDDSSVGTNNQVLSLAMLGDGKVVLGGSFTKFNGDNHYLFARSATGAFVRESFSTNSARDTLTWVRLDGSPLLAPVSFEYSTDSNNFTPLGTASIGADSRTITLSGQAFPTNTQFYIKAKAYSPVSQHGSNSMVEKVWAMYIKPVTLAASAVADTVLVKGSAVSIGGVTARPGLLFSATNLPPGLTIDSSTGRIYGTPTTLGNYAITVSYSDASTSDRYTQNLQVAASTGNASTGDDVQRLLAYSTRAVSSDANPLIIGFIVRGNAPMPVLLRAVGPTLRVIAPSITNPMVAPKATLYQVTAQGPVKQLELQAWNDASGDLARETARVGAQPLVAGSKDVSTIATLQPGAYSWVVTDTGSSSGTVLAEVYDDNAVGAVNPSRIADCSTRGYVDAADHMISGYLIDGNSQKRTLLRAVGPSLPSYVSNVLNDPRVVFHLQDGTAVASNDDWQSQASTTNGWNVGTGSEVAAAIQSVQLSTFPSGSKDSALLVTIPSGVYAFEVAGTNTNSGNVLIEIYLP